MWLVPCRRQARLPPVLPHLESPERVAAHQGCSGLSPRCISNPRWQVLLTARQTHTVSGRVSRRCSEEVGRPDDVVTKCQKKQNEARLLTRWLSSGLRRQALVGPLGVWPYSLICKSLPSGPRRRQTGGPGDFSWCCFSICALHACQSEAVLLLPPREDVTGHSVNHLVRNVPCDREILREHDACGCATAKSHATPFALRLARGPSRTHLRTPRKLLEAARHVLRSEKEALPCRVRVYLGPCRGYRRGQLESRSVPQSRIPMPWVRFDPNLGERSILHIGTEK